MPQVWNSGLRASRGNSSVVQFMLQNSLWLQAEAKNTSLLSTFPCPIPLPSFPFSWEHSSNKEHALESLSQALLLVNMTKDTHYVWQCLSLLGWAIPCWQRVSAQQTPLKLPSSKWGKSSLVSVFPKFVCQYHPHPFPQDLPTWDFLIRQNTSFVSFMSCKYLPSPCDLPFHSYSVP